jgi:hypothetical protein
MRRPGQPPWHVFDVGSCPSPRRAKTVVQPSYEGPVGCFRPQGLETDALIPLPDHFEYAATPSPLSNYRSPGLDSIQADLGSV